MLVDQRFEAGSEHGRIEVEALAEVAVEPGQPVVLLGGLDPLAYNGHPEVVGDCDDGADDAVAAAVVPEVRDECTVDF